jgi:hypothetical protein
MNSKEQWYEWAMKLKRAYIDTWMNSRRIQITELIQREYK